MEPAIGNRSEAAKAADGTRMPPGNLALEQSVEPSPSAYSPGSDISFGSGKRGTLETAQADGRR